MILTKKRRFIAMASQFPHEIGFLRPHMKLKRAMSTDVRILGSEQGGARGHTLRMNRVALLENSAAPGQPVQVGRDRRSLAIQAERAGFELIGAKQKDVWGGGGRDGRHRSELAISLDDSIRERKVKVGNSFQLFSTIVVIVFSCAFYLFCLLTDTEVIWTLHDGAKRRKPLTLQRKSHHA
jgi:hypothetical protein